MKQIPLSQGKFALVDDQDYEWLSQWKWYFDGQYAAREEHVYNNPDRDSIKVYMHRVINQTPIGKPTDHANHNKLDNRRSNLRSCTLGENIANRPTRRDSKTGVRGVSWHKTHRLFYARITRNGKKRVLGYFKTKEEAGEAYRNAANQLYGEFSLFNSV